MVQAAAPVPEVGTLGRDARAVYAIWLRELTRFASAPARIVGTVGQLLVYLFIMGTGFGATFRAAAAPPGFSYLVFMFPGILGVTIMSTSLFSAMSIISDRQFGFLKGVLVAPVARSSIVLGKIAGGATVATIQGLILLLLAPLVGARLAPVEILKLSVVMVLIASVLTSLGLAIASWITMMEGFQVIMQFLVVPMWLLSGAFFPLRGLPGWMGVLVRADPLTYAVDALRGVVYGGSPFAAAFVLHPLRIDLGILGVMLVVMFGLALATFRSHED